MEAGAVPHFRAGGPSAAAQTFGARERHSRDETATMVDVGLNSGAPMGVPTFAEIGKMLRRGDIALAVGMLTILVVLILPLPPIAARHVARGVDHPVDPDPDDVAVHPGTARILVLPDDPPDLDHAAAGTQPRVHAADPRAWPRGHRRRGSCHRGVRPFRDGRQLRHRRHHLHHPGDRELRRHHQGLGPHRRGRGALSPRRHARQADGYRRRSVRGPDRRDSGQEASQGAGGRERTSTAPMDGASQIRARRRHRRPPRGVHQHHRRHDHRHRPARHVVLRRGATYTLLTVGDGLVTQIPALIVSTAAGLLVAKAGVAGAADKALLGQLSDYRNALGMAGPVPACR